MGKAASISNALFHSPFFQLWLRRQNFNGNDINATSYAGYLLGEVYSQLSNCGPLLLKYGCEHPMFGKTPRPQQYKDSMKKKGFEQSVTNKLTPTKLKLFFTKK